MVAVQSGLAALRVHGSPLGVVMAAAEAARFPAALQLPPTTTTSADLVQQQVNAMGQRQQQRAGSPHPPCTAAQIGRLSCQMAQQSGQPALQAVISMAESATGQPALGLFGAASRSRHTGDNRQADGSLMYPDLDEETPVVYTGEHSRTRHFACC